MATQNIESFIFEDPQNAGQFMTNIHMVVKTGMDFSEDDRESGLQTTIIHEFKDSFDVVRRGSWNDLHTYFAELEEAAGNDEDAAWFRSQLR